MITLTTGTTPSARSAGSRTAVALSYILSYPLSYAAVVVVATAWLGTDATLAAALAPAVVAATVDARSGRLPNRLVALVASASLAGAIVAAHGSVSAVAGAVTGTVGFAGPLLAVHLVAPAAIGFGDVKLATALGVVLGLVDGRLGLVALCVATAATASWGLLRRRDVVPLGPGLVVGSIVVLAMARIAS